MKKLLYRFGLWLVHKTSPIDPLLAAATAACRTVQALDAGGEYKRHQAYALLIDQFPSVPRRHLAYAIEVAIQMNAHVAN